MRNSYYSKDKCGISYEVLKNRAAIFANNILDEDELTEFKISNGWIWRTLKRNNLIDVRLHGEGNDLLDQNANNEIKKFKEKLLDIIEINNISLEHIWNADQTGLYYQIFYRIYFN